VEKQDNFKLLFTIDKQ